MTTCLRLLLLCLCNFQVSQLQGEEDTADDSLSEAVNGSLAEGDAAEEEDAEELVSIPDNIQYLAHFLRFLSISHAFVAFAMMVAYYCLKVSLYVC